MRRSLSFDTSPPLAIPLRFLMSAPLFAVLAAALLCRLGPAAWTSRWSPATLALTHLLTLGCLSSAMAGALMQILAVVGGVRLPCERTTARVLLLLGAGTLLLAGGFLLSRPLLFRMALPLLPIAMLWLAVAGFFALLRADAPGADATLAGCALALGALVVTTLAGAAMALLFAWPDAMPPRLSQVLAQLVDLHAMWGLAGWVGLLVAAVAYQVVPMFQVTEIYPCMLTRWLLPGLFALLLLRTLAIAAANDPAWAAPALTASRWMLWLIAAGYSGFAVVTLYLLAHRKRPQPDATTLFWRLSLASLPAAAGLLSMRWMAGMHVGEVGGGDGAALALGVLLIVGFAYSAINGMLYKIVPFLLWYHMQDSVRQIGVRVPPVREILPDGRARRQFRLHLLATVLLLAATVWPAALSRPAALALGASSAWCWINLWQASRLYRRFFIEGKGHAR